MQQRIILQTYDEDRRAGRLRLRRMIKRVHVRVGVARPGEVDEEWLDEVLEGPIALRIQLQVCIPDPEIGRNAWRDISVEVVIVGRAGETR
jgi:hypothetical protein